MTLFVDNSNGYISFGDTDIHPKPKGAIDLTMKSIARYYLPKIWVPLFLLLIENLY